MIPIMGKLFRHALFGVGFLIFNIFWIADKSDLLARWVIYPRRGQWMMQPGDRSSPCERMQRGAKARDRHLCAALRGGVPAACRIATAYGRVGVALRVTVWPDLS